MITSNNMETNRDKCRTYGKFATEWLLTTVEETLDIP